MAEPPQSVHPPTRGLLERDSELAALGAAITAGRGGVGGVVLLEGPAGIGKTVLLEAAVARAERVGMTVLACRGGEFEHDFVFGAVHQLFDAPVRALTESERAVVLAGAAGLAGPLLLGPVDQVRQPMLDGFAMLHGLYWLCVNLAARSPLMLAVDDVHWIDPPSLRWLNFLAARLDGLPILLVLAARDDEPDTTGDRLAALRAAVGEQILRPRGLSPDAVADIIRHRLGPTAAPEFCHAAHTATLGNPFYLRALLSATRGDDVPPTVQAGAALLQRGPPSIGEALARRLSRHPDALAFARALAILGPRSPIRHVTALAGLDIEDAADAADLLASMRILTAEAPLRFIHPIVRSAIRAYLPHWHRSRLHHRAAEILAADGAGPEVVAGQLLHSEPAAQPWAVDVLRRAAATALLDGAPDGAITYLRRALAEPLPAELRPQVLVELGRATYLSGDPAGSDLLGQALALTVEPGHKVAIILELANALAMGDRPGQALAVLTDGFDQIAHQDPDLSLRFEAQLIGTATMSAATRLAVHRRVGHRPVTDIPDSPNGQMYRAILTMAGAIEGWPAQTIHALAEQALNAAELTPGDPTAAQFAQVPAVSLAITDSLPRALWWFDRALDDARAHGSLIEFAVASSWRSDVHYRIGNLADAHADAHTALALTELGGWGAHTPFAHSALLTVLIERGELDTAAAILDTIPTGEWHKDSPLAAALRATIGRVWIAQGRLREGLHEIEAAGQWYETWGLKNPSICPWRTQAALGLDRLGDTDQARSLAAEEIALSRPLGQPRTLGMALRAAGLVEHSNRGVELLHEAVTVLATSPSPLEHSRALIDLGAALRRTGHPTDARPPLRDGLDLADQCGAVTLADHARQELIATGARPRRRRITGLDALTPAERRVAELAAHGSTNPQIAQKLFVTTKTIETHLGHVYTKLAIRTRADLTRTITESKATGLPAEQVEPRDAPTSRPLV